MIKYITLLLTTFLCFSCATKKNANPENSTVTEIYQGVLGGAGEEGIDEGTQIIQSEEEWNSFLMKLNAVNPVSDRFTTEIDFSNKNVIIAADRVRSTGGFSIKLNKVENSKDEIIFNVERIGPKPSDMVASVITQPIHIILINKTNKKIVFVTK